MGRIRSIKPDFFFDYELSILPAMTRLAFIGLWCNADREGRLLDIPVKLKALIFPYDKRIDMEDTLKQLTKKPFIVRYEQDSKKYIQIVRWLDHQKIHHTEHDSLIPCFNGDLTVNSRLNNGEVTVNEPLLNGEHIPLLNGYLTVNSPLLNGEESVGKEGKGKEGRGPIPPSIKTKFREFVLLTDLQYKELCDQIGPEETDRYIERLDNYIGASGKKYNSHFHVIKGWFRRDLDKNVSVKKGVMMNTL